MFKRFFFHNANINKSKISKMALHSNESTLAQFERLNQDPKFADILANMHIIEKKLSYNNQCDIISSVELSKLLDLEQESLKVSMY
jgi:hypothetical protein